MPLEPSTKRAVAFIDGQNLFNAAKKAFGYTYPNYDILALCKAVCLNAGWELTQIRFYTGIPDSSDRRHAFWVAKLAAMGRQSIHVCSRPLRYLNKVVKLADGSEQAILVGEEKGIDVRIAIDVIRMAHHQEYDVAIVFSQDQDLAEAAKEIRTIAREQSRWIKIASAYPTSPTYKKKEELIIQTGYKLIGLFIIHALTQRIIVALPPQLHNRSLSPTSRLGGGRSSARRLSAPSRRHPL